MSGPYTLGGRYSEYYYAAFSGAFLTLYNQSEQDHTNVSL